MRISLFGKINYFLEKLNKYEISRIKFSAIFSTFIIFISNFPILYTKLSSNFGNIAFTEKLLINFFEISFSYFAIFITIYFISFIKIIREVLLFLILFICGFCAYSFNKFTIIFDQTVIANLLDNAGDVGSVFIFKDFILYSSLLLLIPFLFALKIKIKQSADLKKEVLLILFILTIFVAILSSFHHSKRKGIIFSYPPFGPTKALFQYYSDIGNNLNEAKLLPINQIIKSNFTQKINDLKVVLIIGESARTKNFSIYNYSRETSPRIKKIKNFIAFSNVTPCSNLTRDSVGCMLSYKTAKEFKSPAREESVIKVFENKKFSTSWFSTQKAVGDNNGLLLLAKEAQKFYFGDKISAKIGGNMVYDEYLLDDLETAISGSNNSFIVLHAQGSHFLFNERYPDNFKVFIPTCEEKDLKKCTKEQIINSYDNSILYTDFFIESVINILRNKNAILFYISDHGQFLGENNIYYHGPSDSKESDVHKVPMFFWMSNNLLKNKIYYQKFLQAQQKINQELSHDNLFYSLLGCSGIETNQKNNLDICK